MADLLKDYLWIPKKQDIKHFTFKFANETTNVPLVRSVRRKRVFVTQVMSPTCVMLSVVNLGSEGVE